MGLIDAIYKKYQGIRGHAEENTANHIKKWLSHARLGGLISYREDDYTELSKINSLHKQCIQAETPPVLEINEEKRIPKANAHEITSSLCFEYYDNRGDLKNLMDSLFKIIQTCVNARMSAHEATGYNHLNGAAILFCAEMAQWTNTMAKLSTDEKMLESVIKRIHYLDALLEHEVFENEPKKDYAIDLLIFNLSNILEKLIKPRIQAKLHSRTSRDFFNTLTNETLTFFAKITHGLYCLYSNQNKNTSELYNFEANTYFIHNEFSQGIEKTSLGRLFKELTDAYTNTHGYLQIEDTKQGSVTSPAESLDLDLKNIKSKTSGLDITVFEHPELVEHLLEVFLLLKKFCLLMNAFKQYYSLAGDGGDILIYIALCQETDAIISCYSHLRDQLLKKIDDINTLASSIMFNLISKQEKSPWRAKYLCYKKDVEMAKEAFSTCNIQINHIITNMEKVSSRDYADEVESKILNLRKILLKLSNDLVLKMDFQKIKNKDNNKNSNDVISENKKTFISSETTISLQPGKQENDNISGDFNKVQSQMNDNMTSYGQMRENITITRNTSILSSNPLQLNEISYASLMKKREEQRRKHHNLLEHVQNTQQILDDHKNTNQTAAKQSTN
jgi:hypothetical protein